MKGIGLLMLIAILIFPVKSYAKTFAYIFVDDMVIKLDTETDAEVSRITSASGIEGSLDFKENGCAVDIENRYLITLNDSSPFGFFVYDLQNMNQIKNVQFPEMISDPYDQKIVYPQKGTKFYIEIYDKSINNGQGGLVNLAYDKKTHNYLGAVDNILNTISEKSWFSEDQLKIYVASKEKNLRVYDSQTLRLESTVDMSSVFALNLWGKAIDDIRNGLILLSENKKTHREDKDSYYFLTYRLSDSYKTPRTLTDLVDISEAFLIPNSSKTVFNELVYETGGVRILKKGTVISNKLQVYDFITGNKIGAISFETNYGGEVRGIRPSGDKLYYQVFSKDESKIKLAVVDLTTLKVIKELQIPKTYFMVFFEE